MGFTLLGRKSGMTHIFGPTGNVIPCTVIEIQPHVVLRVKNKESDGYGAVVLGAFPLSEKEVKKLSKPYVGQFLSRKIEAHRHMLEFHVDDNSSFEEKGRLSVDSFKEGSFVDVSGISKGKGYQGVIKRYGARRLLKTHGCGPVMRHLGSTGSLTSHGRVFKNRKGAGRMGGSRVSVQSLLVVKIYKEKGLLLVKGGIPGFLSHLVTVRSAVKRN